MKYVFSFLLLISLSIPARADLDFNLLTTDGYDTLIAKASKENKSILVYKGKDKTAAQKEAADKGWLFYEAASDDKRFEEGVTEVVNFMGVFHQEHITQVAPVVPPTPEPAPVPAQPIIQDARPPRPDGEGWQWDSVQKVWWRFLTQTSSQTSIPFPHKSNVECNQFG